MAVLLRKVDHMLIDRYIEELTKLRQVHGPDLQVVTNGGFGSARKAPLPRIRWMLLKRPTLFWLTGVDPDRERGEKVVRV